ncbi:uncharacterized protein LOC103981588 [Musa acuminata AAA Group]|uniref:uncharacterized protein LOC103981588 n=1 Tax=Musa acuminata AAA Group TaxID=214697 RepID=UPI0031E0D020
MTTTASTDGRVDADPRLPSPRRRVCFSFAAYAKAVVAHLRASGVPVAPGLSDAEFAAVESAYGFKFPPDIRSVLCEGLPVGPGFPNWRSASPQQLRLLLGLPATSILHEVTSGGFWPRAWGPRPQDPSVAVAAAKVVLRRAPSLVPIYRHFYMPASPSLPGNPVFYVRGGDVRPAGLDLADFFQRERPRGWTAGALAPAWVATSARRVEVWTELSEEKVWQERKRGGSPWEVRVDEMLKQAGQRLREGGWRDEEVGEMVLWGSDGYGIGASAAADPAAVLRDQEGVLRKLQLLSLALLRSGWGADDVVESMGWASVEGSEGDYGDMGCGPSQSERDTHPDGATLVDTI